MAINLGENPWILISLIFLEFLLIIIPALVSSKLEKRPFQDIIKEMGFQKDNDLLIKIISGISLGIIFFFLGTYIIIFFRDFIVKNLFGSDFVKTGKEGTISTGPMQPNTTQLVILIILNLIITGPCEEAFFRGFLIKKFEIKFKMSYSTFFSSIIFTLYHIPPFLVPITTIVTYFGYYFAFGVLLSLVFVYFKYSLIPCSIAHSCFNILILLI